MARKKRTGAIEDLFELLFGLTGLYWQVGAVITALLFILGLYSVDALIINYTPTTQLIAQIITNIPWVIYILPAMIFFISFIFGVVTFSAYKQQN